MTDDDQPSPAELEQLARSLAIDGSLGRHDAAIVADALRRLAELDRNRRTPGPPCQD